MKKDRLKPSQETSMSKDEERNESVTVVTKDEVVMAECLQDERPTREQFLALPKVHQDLLLKAVDKNGAHFTPESLAEHKAARLAAMKQGKTRKPAVINGKHHVQVSSGMRS